MQHNSEAGLGKRSVDAVRQVSLPLTSSTALRYLVEPGLSRFTVKAFATGLLSALGHSPTFAIRDFEGEAWLAPATLENAGVRMRVWAGSLELQDHINDQDRREIEHKMRDIVLETARFPEIVYECDSVSSNSSRSQSSVVLDGKLTLRGVTGKLLITAQLSAPGDLLRASGEFAIRQSDYHIKPVTALAGTLKLKDELKFSFDVVSRKRDE